jgi:hypothetical protein
MINNHDASEILNAIEAYGDQERIYGKYRVQQEAGGATEAEVQKRNDAVGRALDEVKRLLRPYLQEPAPEQFEVPERGEYPARDEEATPPVKWQFEQ